MILVGNAVLSDDIKENFFVCDLEACKGACCVEGDAGAPLEEDETKILEEIYPIVKDYITEEGRQAIEKQGVWVIDKDGDKGTPTIGDNREKHSLDGLDAIIKVEMLGLDVEHDGMLGMEIDERSIALIALGYEQLAFGIPVRV